MCPPRQDELLQRITRLEQEGEQLRAGIEGWQGVASRDRELLLRSNRLPLNKEGWYHERTPQVSSCLYLSLNATN